jgi:DNA-binding LytR/AlgR family response regulator
MKSYLIIEDEPLAAEALKNLIQELRPEWTLLDTFDSVETSVRYLSTHSPDLIFMDIHLADGLSFSILEQQTSACPVVFTTAYDQYAIKAFQVNGFDYLLKPILPAELIRVLEKFDKQEQANPDLKSLIQQFTKPVKEYKSRFLVRIADKLISIPVEGISYFYSDEKHTWLVQGKELFQIDFTLDHLEESIDPGKFFRLNRKVLASYSSISKIYNHLNGKLKIELQPAFDSELFVSRERSREFKEWLDK